MEHGACPALGEMNVGVGNHYLKCPQDPLSFLALGTQENSHGPCKCLQPGAQEHWEIGGGEGGHWSRERSKQDFLAQDDLRTTNLERL